MQFCPNCGAQVNEGQAFCFSCGAPVAQQEDAQQNAGFPQPDPTQQNYQYQQQNNQQATFGTNGFKAPIMNRNIGVCLILSIVTCGIYGLYWYFCIVNDLNTAAGTPNDESAGMIILLTIVTCGIYGFVWLYDACDKVDRIRVRNGETPSNSYFLFILFAIFGLFKVDLCLIQKELNKVAAN